MNNDNPAHRDILAGLKASARVDAILKEHRRLPRLPPDARVHLREACFEFCQVQAALITHFHPDTALYNVTSKSHYLLHIGLVAAFINPSYGAVWQGEDMMRTIRRLMASSSFGRNMISGQRAAMDRYCRALDFELHHIELME